VTCIALRDTGIGVHLDGTSGLAFELVRGSTPKEIAEAVWAWERLADGLTKINNLSLNNKE
jgi:hypothetical protein